MRWLDQYFIEILTHFEQLDIKDADSEVLLGYYKELEMMVTEQWDLTLVNDMYAFLFTGLLKGRLKKKYPKEYEIMTKQYISDIANIESLKPIRSLIALSKEAKTEQQLEPLKLLSNNDEVEYYLQKDTPFCMHIKEYINLYGDRNIEELKLESRTFRTDPLLLIQRIVQYAEEDTEQDRKENSLPSPKGIIGFFARKAAIGIGNRERSRMNRSRLYGMMRLLMFRVGQNLAQKGILEEARDIFWLFYEEIQQLSLTSAMGKVSIAEKKTALYIQLKERKLQYKKFEMLPAYSRLIFSDHVFHKNPVRMKEMEYEQ